MWFPIDSDLLPTQGQLGLNGELSTPAVQIQRGTVLVQNCGSCTSRFAFPANCLSFLPAFILKERAREIFWAPLTYSHFDSPKGSGALAARSPVTHWSPTVLPGQRTSSPGSASPRSSNFSHPGWRWHSRDTSRPHGVCSAFQSSALF